MSTRRRPPACVAVLAVLVRPRQRGVGRPPPAQRDALLHDDDLRPILLHHAVEGEALSILDLGAADARVLLGDVVVANEVVHLVDTVLLPEAVEVACLPSNDRGLERRDRAAHVRHRDGSR